MNTNSQAYSASLQLLIIGYAVIHKDNRSRQTYLAINPLVDVAKDMGSSEDDLNIALRELEAGNYIDIKSDGRLPEGPVYLLNESSALRAAELAPTQNADPSLPFNRFVEAATKTEDFCAGYGLNHQRAFLLQSPPFTGLQCDAASGATASAYSPRSNRWQMPQGMYQGYQGYQAPQGSGRETYADVPPGPAGAPLIKHTTIVKGIELDADDARLLAFKLGQFLNMMGPMVTLNDKDFQIHVTFKGIEFNLDEAQEVLTVLS